jgi:hypothetical protein
MPRSKLQQQLRLLGGFAGQGHHDARAAMGRRGAKQRLGVLL